MPPAEDRPYHHGDLRRAVIDTAMEMLNAAGSEFTLREVARRAGVSHAAPYKHFPDKAALLTEIALIGFDRLRAAMIAAGSGALADARSDRAGSDRVAELMAMARAYLDFGRDNTALYRLMFGAELGQNCRVHRDPRAMGALDEVLGMLERGQADGTIRRRPARGQAAACWAQLHGLTLLTLDGLLNAEKVGDGAVEAALAVLLEGLVQPATACA